LFVILGYVYLVWRLCNKLQEEKIEKLLNISEKHTKKTLIVRHSWIWCVCSFKFRIWKWKSLHIKLQNVNLIIL